MDREALTTLTNYFVKQKESQPQHETHFSFFFIFRDQSV